MDTSTNERISAYVADIARQDSRLTEAYLFGSYARRQDCADSDIDVALILEGLPDEERLDLQVKFLILAGQFDSRIEPHPLSRSDFDAENPFALEIRRTGIRISPPASKHSI